MIAAKVRSLGICGKGGDKRKMTIIEKPTQANADSALGNGDE